MSTCEHSDTIVEPTGAYVSVDCTDDAVQRIVWRDLSFVDTPFELNDTVLCAEHAEELKTEIDVDDRRMQLVTVDGMVD